MVTKFITDHSWRKIKKAARKNVDWHLLRDWESESTRCRIPSRPVWHKRFLGVNCTSSNSSAMWQLRKQKLLKNEISFWFRRNICMNVKRHFKKDVFSSVRRLIECSEICERFWVFIRYMVPTSKFFTTGVWVVRTLQWFFHSFVFHSKFISHFFPTWKTYSSFLPSHVRVRLFSRNFFFYWFVNNLPLKQILCLRVYSKPIFLIDENKLLSFCLLTKIYFIFNRWC